MISLNNAILTRPASIEDYETLFSMMRDFAHFQKTPERLTLTLEQLKKDKDIFHCIVAVTRDNSIVGFSTWFFAYYSWTGKAVYMDDLYVVEEYRNKGVGSRLLQAVIQVAKEAGCTKVKWQVSRWNDAGICFYEKMGATIDEVDINCDLKIY